MLHPKRVFNCRFLAIEITKLYFGLKYRKENTFYVTI